MSNRLSALSLVLSIGLSFAVEIPPCKNNPLKEQLLPKSLNGSKVLVSRKISKIRDLDNNEEILETTTRARMMRRGELTDIPDENFVHLKPLVRLIYSTNKKQKHELEEEVNKFFKIKANHKKGDRRLISNFDVCQYYLKKKEVLYREHYDSFVRFRFIPDLISLKDDLDIRKKQGNYVFMNRAYLYLYEIFIKVRDLSFKHGIVFNELNMDQLTVHSTSDILFINFLNSYENKNKKYYDIFRVLQGFVSEFIAFAKEYVTTSSKESLEEILESLRVNPVIQENDEENEGLKNRFYKILKDLEPKFLKTKEYSKEDPKNNFDDFNYLYMQRKEEDYQDMFLIEKEEEGNLTLF